VSLVPPVSRDEAPRAVAALFESGEAQYGRVLEAWAALAHNPDTFVAYMPFLRSVAGSQILPARVRELTAVRVGVLNRCRYTVSHRLRSARAAGVPDEDLLAVARGDYHGFAPEEAAALRFTDQLTLRPPEVSYHDAPQAVDAGLLDEVRAHFGTPQLVALAMNVSVWNYLARFHRVMDFDLDMPAPPEEMDALL
jgi:AhpD family alkylhydroperoxidase